MKKIHILLLPALLWALTRSSIAVPMTEYCPSDDNGNSRPGTEAWWFWKSNSSVSDPVPVSTYTWSGSLPEGWRAHGWEDTYPYGTLYTPDIGKKCIFTSATYSPSDGTHPSWIECRYSCDYPRKWLDLIKTPIRNNNPIQIKNKYPPPSVKGWIAHTDPPPFDNRLSCYVDTSYLTSHAPPTGIVVSDCPFNSDF